MIMHAVQPTDTHRCIGGVFVLRGHDGYEVSFRIYLDKVNKRLLVRSVIDQGVRIDLSRPEAIQLIAADPNGTPLTPEGMQLEANQREQYVLPQQPPIWEPFVSPVAQWTTTTAGAVAQAMVDNGTVRLGGQHIPRGPFEIEIEEDSPRQNNQGITIQGD